MSANFACGSYGDFKTVLEGLPSKVGPVYYRSGSGGFFVVGFTVDLKYAVSGIDGTPNQVPANFLTDFPNAIELTGTSPQAGSIGTFAIV